jgi:uncharacterized protein YbbC (DUF1343 family)
MRRHFLLVLLVVISLTAAAQPPKLKTGADQLDIVLAKLGEKRVGLLINQTSLIGNTHLADTLKSCKARLVKIYAPEHGFRGTADAGEVVKDGIDTKTGLPVVSLYGSNKKATPEQLSDIDVVVFDVQDVGTRFFTYISTLTYMMEACAESNKKLIVLDRPNPNGSYVDGPIMQPEFKSFVGMHPVPIVHGMTIGEYAQMVNGEGWLTGGTKCDLEVVVMKNWKHSDPYHVPVRPSPNLPNDHGIGLYPSTCLLEGTALSVGRGTQTPFELLGHPSMKSLSFTFTPVSIDGMAKTPPLQDQLCYGIDLRKEKIPHKVDLQYVITLYNAFPDKEKFFIPYFEKLAGTKELREQIKKGMTDQQIHATWKKGLDAFKEKRKKYLLYK